MSSALLFMYAATLVGTDSPHPGCHHRHHTLEAQRVRAKDKPEAALSFP